MRAARPQPAAALRRLTAAFYALSIVVVLSAGISFAERVRLHSLPFDARDGVSLRGARSLRLAVHTADPPELARRIVGWIPKEVHDDHLVLVVRGYPHRRDRPGVETLRPSFTVDYDEPSVVRVHSQAEQELGPKPTGAQLTDFVMRFIHDKNLDRGRDIASQVARRRAGDCTEHAVLLTALARSFGMPARMLQGFVIDAVSHQPGAYGHEWAEIYDGSEWRLADAALGTTSGLHYIPDLQIEDEGPGWASRLAARLGSAAVTKIEVLAAEP